MGNFYKDFIEPEEDDNNQEDVDGYFVPSDQYQDSNQDIYKKKDDLNYQNSYAKSSENQKNLDRFDLIMENASGKKDTFIDRNNLGIKIFMTVFWGVVIGALAYYVISWLAIN